MQSLVGIWRLCCTVSHLVRSGPAAQSFSATTEDEAVDGRSTTVDFSNVCSRPPAARLSARLAGEFDPLATVKFREMYELPVYHVLLQKER
jgi:hypothetical protein